MILIRTESGKAVDFPSSWDELKPRQIRRIWKIQDRCLRSGTSPMEFSVLILLYLLKIQPSFTAHPGDKFKENIYMLCDQCLGFMFSGNGATLHFTSTANPLPRIGFRRGPGDMFQKLTFGEFRHAAAALQTYIRSRNADDLDECLALLWRTPSLKANRAGRRATPPGGLMFRMDLAMTKRMASWRKTLALAWFCNTMQRLQSGKLIIDGETIDLSLLFSSQGGKHGLECGWNDLLVQLAKDGILGNIERVDEEPLMSILSIMWSNYKEAKRYEETLKANKSK